MKTSLKKTVTYVDGIKTSIDPELGWVVIQLEGAHEVVRIRTTPVMAKLVAEQISKTADDAYSIKHRVQSAKEKS